jgi:hypothetical protein
MTIFVNPPTPIANSQIQFVGWIYPSLGSSQQVTVSLSQAPSCTNTILNIAGNTDSTGSTYIFNVTLGQGYLSNIIPGNYSAFAHVSNSQLSSLCQDFTVFTSLPTALTLSVNPPNPAANSTVQFQGMITPNLNNTQTIGVILYPGNTCGLYGIPGIHGNTDNTGSSYNVSENLGSGLLAKVGPGPYSAVAHVLSTQIWSTCVHFTVSAPVPEFPVNLPALVILTLILSAQIARRTSRKKTA